MSLLQVARRARPGTGATIHSRFGATEWLGAKLKRLREPAGEHELIEGGFFRSGRAAEFPRCGAGDLPASCPHDACRNLLAQAPKPLKNSHLCDNSRNTLR